MLCTRDHRPKKATRATKVPNVTSYEDTHQTKKNKTTYHKGPEPKNSYPPSIKISISSVKKDVPVLIFLLTEPTPKVQILWVST